MKNQTIIRKLGSLFLMLAMVLAMSVTALPVFAAGGSISVKYNPDVEGLGSTNFKLYKVAKYDHDKDGQSIFVLDGDFAACTGVDLNTPTKVEEWLSEAGKLGNYAKNHESDLTPVWSGSLNRSDSFQTIGGDTSFDNGIYLLVGEEQLVEEQFWAPVPVLIQVFNGDRKFTIDNAELKMTSRALVHKHTVMKTWQDDGYVDGRPGSVKIGIYNGSTLVDTIELSNSKGWDYTWYSYEGKDGWVYTSKDPSDPNSKGVETSKLNEGNKYALSYGNKNSSWGVEEIAPAKYDDGENYYISPSPDAKTTEDDTEFFNVVNSVLIPVDHDPPVKKIITGDEPEEDETFEFELVAISTTADVKNMPMPEGSDGKVKTMTTVGAEEKEFGEIIFRVPGQYIYEVKEINNGKDGYTYDNTVYKLVYDISITKTSSGTYQAEKQLNVYKNGEIYEKAAFEFTNEYTGEVPDEPDKPGKKPNTGDYNNYVLPAAIFAAALIAFIVVLVRRRKQNNDK